VIAQTEGPPFAFAGSTIEVLAPYPGRGPNRNNRPENNDSLALRIAYGERSFLLTGDLERAEEGRLLAEDRIRVSDVLKVGHHGSKTSTIDPFLDAVRPSLAIISAGFENSFGHPQPEVLGRLENRRTAVLRTDLAGLSTVRTDGKRLWYETWNGSARSAPILAKLPIFKGLLQ
jgi:competence protein ComEC